MVSIHHLYFLHVVDAVFDFADPAALAVMAQTCREWRRRSLSVFHTICGYEILEEYPKPTVVVWDQLDKVVFFRGWAQLALLSECRVLDIRNSSNARPERVTFLRKLETIRYHRHLDSQQVTHKSLPLPALQIVCQNHVYSFGSPVPAVKTLVVHCAMPHAQLLISDEADFSGLTGLLRFVLIFEHPLNDIVNYKRNSRSTARTQLRLTRELINAALRERASVFLVGTEAFSPEAVADLQLGHGHKRMSYDSALQSKELIRLVTLDSYRRGVGEKEWAVQTCWDKPLDP